MSSVHIHIRHGQETNVHYHNHSSRDSVVIFIESSTVHPSNFITQHVRSNLPCSKYFQHAAVSIPARFKTRVYELSLYHRLEYSSVVVPINQYIRLVLMFMFH